MLLAHPDQYLLEEARRAVAHRRRAAARRLHDRGRARRARRDVGRRQRLQDVPRRARATSTRVLAQTPTSIVEGEYETGAQEQLYIEPNGMIAVADPDDGVTVWGSMQCPYYVHKALKPLFGLPARQGARHPDGDRRRLRRQGRVSVDDRRARRAARVEVAAAR